MLRLSKIFHSYGLLVWSAPPPPYAVLNGHKEDRGEAPAKTRFTLAWNEQTRLYLGL
jgi:hypothetical protein